MVIGSTRTVSSGPTARILLAYLEALTGQLYLAIPLARLVALHLAGGTAHEEERST